jgi:hypothetical protein
VKADATVKDETFFLCCMVCQKKLDDPDTYLAELANIRARSDKETR